MAARGDLVFLGHASLKAKQLRACLRDLQKLPALPALADKVDLYHRFMLLDYLMNFDRYGVPFRNYLGLQVRGGWSDLLAQASRDPIDDWDAALKNANRRYKRLVAALRNPDRAARERKLARVEADLNALFQKVVDSRVLAPNRPGGKATPRERGQAVGDLMMWLVRPGWLARPGVRTVQQNVDLARQTQDNLWLAFALAWYQRDHGRYPPKLAALAPRYLKRIPGDLFSGKALIYRPARNSFLVYSVGLNGKDEGGRGHDGRPPGDDLSVRLAPPRVPKK
jgi:hypothetical protein